MQLQITMDDSHIKSLQQLKRFLKLDSEFQFKVKDKKERYTWIASVLKRFNYHHLKKKKDRTIVRRYIQKMTNTSRAQLNRLIEKHRRTGQLVPYASVKKRNHFHTVYTPKDIALLIETDVAHNHLSGAATKKILQREYEIFHRLEYPARVSDEQSRPVAPRFETPRR